MWVKILASASLCAVLVTGAALVSMAKSPGGAPPGSTARYDGAAVSTISKGSKVDLADHVGREGELTVFEFTADW